MLMTKYTYLIQQGADGSLHLVVTRLSDGRLKYFYRRCGSLSGLKATMDNMPDSLVEGYYPEGKKGKTSSIDNWAFLGFNLDRLVAEARAEVAYRLSLEVKEVHEHFGWKYQA